MPSINIHPTGGRAATGGGGASGQESMVFKLFKRWMNTGNPADLDALITAGSAYNNVGRFFGLAKTGGRGAGGAGGAASTGGGGPRLPPKIDINMTGARAAGGNADVVAAIRELGTKLDRLVTLTSGESVSQAAERVATRGPSRAAIRRATPIPAHVVSRRTARFTEAEPLITGIRPFVPRSVVEGSLWEMRQQGLVEAMANASNPAWRAAHIAKRLTPIAPAGPALPPSIINAAFRNAAIPFHRPAGREFVGLGPGITTTGGQFRYQGPLPPIGGGGGFTLWPSSGQGGALVPAGRWPPTANPNFTMGGGGGSGGTGGIPLNFPSPGRMAMFRAISGGLSAVPKVAGGALAVGILAAELSKWAVKSSFPWNEFSLSLGRLGAAGGGGWQGMRGAFWQGAGVVPPALAEAGISQTQAVNLLNAWPGALGGGKSQLALAAMLGGTQWMPGLGTPSRQEAAISILGKASGLGMATSNTQIQQLLNRVAGQSLAQNNAGNSALYYLRAIDTKIGAIASGRGGPISIASISALQGSLAAGGGPGGKSGAFLQSITAGNASFATTPTPLNYVIMQQTAQRFASTPAALQKLLGPGLWKQFQSDPAMRKLISDYFSAVDKYGVSSWRAQYFWRQIAGAAGATGSRAIIGAESQVAGSMLPGGPGNAEIGTAFVTGGNPLSAAAFNLNLPAAKSFSLPGGARVGSKLMSDIASAASAAGMKHPEFLAGILGGEGGLYGKTPPGQPQNAGWVTPPAVRQLAREGKLPAFLSNASDKQVNAWISSQSRETMLQVSAMYWGDVAPGSSLTAKIAHYTGLQPGTKQFGSYLKNFGVGMGTFQNTVQTANGKPPLSQREFQAEIENLGLAASRAAASATVPLVGAGANLMNGSIQSVNDSMDQLIQASDVQNARMHDLANAWSSVSAALTQGPGGSSSPAAPNSQSRPAWTIR